MMLPLRVQITIHGWARNWDELEHFGCSPTLRLILFLF